MYEFSLPSPPTQKGVIYKSCPATLFALESIATPGTFIAETLIPAGESFSIKKGGNIDENVNEHTDVSNIGTANHHLVAAGDFYVKNDTDVKIPALGDRVQDNETTPRNWIVTAEPEVTNYSEGGRALMVKLELKYYPAVHAAY